MSLVSARNKFVNNKYKKRNYFLIYTVLFAITTLLVFATLLAEHKTLVWNVDGLNQHYKALVYYGRYLKEIAANFLQGNFHVPQWDINIAEGTDILQTLQYYVIGDPFSALCIFVPEKYMVYLYCFLIILRAYLAGIAFSCFCFYFKLESRYGILAGALSYSYCYWIILNTARHPYFLNPLIYLPLIIIGVEKIIKKENPALFIISVFITGLSNFYFFYIIGMLTVIYVVVRLIFIYKTQVSKIILTILKIGLFTIVAVLMAAVIFIPICYMFLSDSRIGMEKYIRIIYPLNYYTRLALVFSTNTDQHWLCLGYSAPALVAAFLLFAKRKKNTIIKVFFILGLIIMCFAICGAMLNGMSYVANRWSFSFALVMSFTLAKMWPDLMKINKKQTIFLFVAVAIFFSLCAIADINNLTAAVTSIFIMLLFIILCSRPTKTIPLLNSHRIQQISILLIIISIAGVSFYHFSTTSDGYSTQCLTKSQVENRTTYNCAELVKGQAKEDDVDEFYRYSGNELDENTGMLAGVSSTQYYWSISNPSITDFLNQLDNRSYTLYDYESFDERASITTLASVRYYANYSNTSDYVPYGFEYIGQRNALDYREDKDEIRQNVIEKGNDISQKEKDKYNSLTFNTYKLYRNKYTLPLGYTYSNYTDEKYFSKLSPIDKQESMLQNVYIENYDGNKQATKSNATSINLPYGLEFTDENGLESKDITIQDNVITTTEDNQNLTLTFNGIKNSETYLLIKGFNYDDNPKYKIYLDKDDKYDPLKLYGKQEWNNLPKDYQITYSDEIKYGYHEDYIYLKVSPSVGRSKTIKYRTKYDSYSNGRKEFAYCFNSENHAQNSITITFPKTGFYYFDSIEVICQPMDNYEKEINALKENILENVEIGTDEISGDITLDESKILCLSLPYSEGWKAYVDGQEATIYKANIKYMALDLDTGNHHIELKYTRPFQKIGYLLSALGICIFIALMIIYAVKKKKKH